ncbi:T9SS type A sorting domain-containing protein [Meridianimaribacter flavus]|uniref:Secreted protein (Por secretion system target) n=1 Tax=Meridianimaribacter flavus TaxID=571115 RepID=A0ABY2G1E6_9FLAO|nr:T9SS type A sorting domain-containing protein [Meridianimaribacter flavus]TDY05815.1 putative secreted protein (Por secretion system target) [Meridianimaribacter flavus]
MKHLYLFFTFLFCVSANAQNEDLLGEWYLYNINRNSNTIANIYSYVTLNLTEDTNNSNFNFSAMSSCNPIFSGEYEVTSSDITIFSADVGLADCFPSEEYEGEFEGYYLGILLNGESYPNELSWSITGSGNDAVLTLTKANGDYLTFSRQQMPTDLFGNWFLHSLEVNSTSVEIPESATPTLNFDNTQGPTTNGFEFEGELACNSFSGEFSHSPNSTFDILYYTETLGICSSPDENNFESSYALVLPSYDIGGNFETVNYEITGTGNNQTLIINNITNNSVAVYGRQTLSYTENEIVNSIRLKENPVNENLSFYNLNNESELFFTMYSIQGKTITSQNLLDAEINVNHLPSGIYFITISDKLHNSKTLKFIKL